MLIRPERPGDEDAIHHLTVAAFEPMEFSNGSESSIIEGLRRSGDLILSLVAEENGKIVGHAAFSPVTIGGAADDWFGLGPISVKPERQRQGIGRALILRGMELLKSRGATWLRADRRSGFLQPIRLSQRRSVVTWRPGPALCSEDHLLWSSTRGRCHLRSGI